MRKLFCLILALAVVSPVAAAMKPVGVAVPADRVMDLPGESLNPTNLRGGNLPGVCDAIGLTNFCCEFLGDPTCDDAPGSYSGGSAACYSDYWDDSADGSYTADWTHAWLPSTGGIIPIFLDEPIDFGVLDPGDYSFCVGFTFDPFPTPPMSVTVDTGFRTRPASGGSAQSIVNSFTLNP